MTKRSCRQPISVDKCLPGFTQIAIRYSLASRLGLSRVVDVVHVDRHGRGVIEGTQDAADILVRAVLAPSFVQRSCGFAFEIDQVRIALDHQHLAEVQVAMHANSQATGRLFGQRLHMGEDGFFVVQ
ncbi:hypothetical protein D3C87_1532650 [compost metagenome]